VQDEHKGLNLDISEDQASHTAKSMGRGCSQQYFTVLCSILYDAVLKYCTASGTEKQKTIPFVSYWPRKTEKIKTTVIFEERIHIYETFQQQYS
jgi:hypothetical protein